MKLKAIFLSILPLVTALSACSSGSSNSTIYPYQFVVDSGSSGSRVYVYSKVSTESGYVITDLYEKKTSTPLASFANNPSNAGTSVTPLLESAVQFLISESIPNLNLAKVPTSVLGTAGMRLISESSQAAIYRNVAESISILGLMVCQTETLTNH